MEPEHGPTVDGFRIGRRLGGGAHGEVFAATHIPSGVPVALKLLEANDASDDELKAIADKIAAHGLAVGSLVAPVWPGTVGASSMGSEEDRQKFVLAVKKACRIAKIFNDHGVRQYGVIRIDSAESPENWLADPEGNTKKIAETFREAAKVAQDHGERLAAEGEICWAGMHSWRNMINLLEEVGLPEVVGFQADQAQRIQARVRRLGAGNRSCRDHQSNCDRNL